MRATAKVVEWNDDKGYGWLAIGDERLFLHIKDITKRSHWPKVGDAVVYDVGQDAQGRQCAKNVEQLGSGGSLGVISLLMLVLLLAAPIIVLVQFSAMHWWRPLLAVIGGMNLFSVLCYWIDKKRAGAGRWRISEGTLHLQELLGGWPGAFLAQRIFRHKTAKLSYQFVFWLIVAAYEYAAVDFLLGWKIAAHVRRLLGF